MNKPKLYFYEAQPFRVWWIWLIILGISGFFIAATVRQVVFAQPVGKNPSPDVHLVIASTLCLALIVLFGLMRLETRIKADGLYTRFFPFVRFKKRAWAAMQQLHIRRYRPIPEYGGWGIRGWGDNRALNVSGNIGLQIRMASGDRLLIGTKQPQAMDKALRQIPALPGTYSPLSSDFDE